MAVKPICRKWLSVFTTKLPEQRCRKIPETTESSSGYSNSGVKATLVAFFSPQRFYFIQRQRQQWGRWSLLCFWSYKIYGMSKSIIDSLPKVSNLTCLFAFSPSHITLPTVLSKLLCTTYFTQLYVRRITLRWEKHWLLLHSHTWQITLLFTT